MSEKKESGQNRNNTNKKHKHMKAYFEVKKGKSGQYHFNLVAPNHEVILTSEHYPEKANCLKGLKSVQVHSQDIVNFEKRTSKKNEPYFILKARNHEPIGTSEMYSSEQMRDHGIEVVMKYGSATDVQDETSTSDPDDKEVIIIVNGREKTWTKKTISFEEVVVLAFGSISSNPNTCYTVTYSRGSGQKPEGSMVKGQEVKVKSKMVFNVTATDKS